MSHRSEAVRADIAAACNDLTKVYQVAGAPVTGLDGVDKEFPAGRVTTVVGPSGSGKSSLLRILALVDRPSTGSVRIRREEVGCVGIRGRRLLRRTEIGYLFHPSALEHPMFDHLFQMSDAGVQVFVRQDQDATTKVQRGMHSRYAARGRYSWQEASHVQFNRWLVDRYRRHWPKTATN